MEICSCLHTAVTPTEVSRRGNCEMGLGRGCFEGTLRQKAIGGGIFARLGSMSEKYSEPETQKRNPFQPRGRKQKEWTLKKEVIMWKSRDEKPWWV